MKYFVYILYSASINKYYIGHTNDLARRIYEHDLGKEKFTKKGIPWEMKFSCSFDLNTDAIKEERRLKKCKSRKYLENYMNANLPVGRVGRASRHVMSGRSPVQVR